MPALQPTADDLQQALDRLARILNERQANYALIGGLGAAVRGAVRTTWDIDLLVAASQMELPRLLESLQAEAFDLDVYRAICCQRWTYRSFKNRASISVLRKVARASSGVSTSGSCSL